MKKTIFYAALCIATSLGHADVIHFANGDQISGDLVSIRDGVVAVKTSYAGDLAIQQSEVTAIETDEPWVVKDTGAAVTESPLAQLDVAAIAVAALTEEALEPPAEEPAEEEKKDRIWTGSVDMGFSMKSGSTDATNFSLGVNLTRTRPQHVITLNLAGLYGEVDSEINSRRWFGEGKWKVYPDERWYVFGLASMEHDAGRKLDFRWTGGGGVGVDAWKGDRGLWSVEGGLNYSQEWWNLYTPAELDRARSNAAAARESRIRAFVIDLPTVGFSLDRAFRLARDINGLHVENDTRQEDDIVLRLANHIEYSFFKTSKLTHDLTLLPQPTDWDDYSVVSDLLWTTPINQHLSLRINIKTEYDSDPGQENVDKWDNLLQTGLRYQF